MPIRNTPLRRNITLALLLVLPLSTAMAETHTLSAEVLRADLEQLYTTLQEAHFDLFARRDKAAYEARYQAVRDALVHPLSPEEARLEFQRFVAFGNVAHAQIPLPFASFRQYAERGGRALPLAVRVVDGDVFVTENTSGVDELIPGTRITRIDNRPALDWLDELGTFVSADHPAIAYGLMEFWLPALTWFAHGERDAVAVTVRDETGKPKVFTLPFRSLDEIRAARKERAAPSLGIDFSTREMRLLQNHVAYLRPGPFYNTGADGGDARMYDDREFIAFIDDAFRRIIAAETKDLVIDLRDNPGGDKAFSDPMIAWFADREFQFYSSFEFKVSEPTRKAMLARAEEYKDLPASPARVLNEMVELVRAHENGEIVELRIDAAKPREGKRYEGNVYAIINRHSYSNATAVAALLQDYDFATIVGEATHDLPSSYGAMESFTLKNSGIEVHYPKSWFVRPNGDATPRGVQPDVVIPTPVIETAADVVLDATIEHILQQR